MYMFQIITEAKTKPGDLLQQKIFLEVLFIKLATMEELKPLSTVLDKIEGMKKIFEGNTEGSRQYNSTNMTTKILRYIQNRR